MRTSKTTHYSINPATQTVLAEHTEETWDSIQQKVQQSACAFDQGHRLSFEERGSYFKKLAALLRERTERYARLMTEEMGKPIEQSRGEVEKCAWVCTYYADHAAAFLQPEDIPTEHKMTRVYYQPLGTILQVMPWNFPFWQVFRFAAPALMAGNVTLLKHASNVLNCAKAIEALFQEVFPQWVFQHTIASNDDVARILDQEQVQGVAITGSVGAGKVIGQLAGKNIKPCVLELGGSDPFIVLKDADLEAAANTALQSRHHNSGQTCISAKRFIVEAPVAEEFMRLLKTKMRTVVVGDPMKKETDIGPLARLDLAQSLQRQVDASIEKGAKVEVPGGHREGTHYFKPMLLSGVKPGMPAYEEELFGPVGVFFNVKNAEEAIQLANDSIFGLAGTVFSKDEDAALAVALRLEVGAVCINKMMSSDPRVPFGGVKQSGVGRELGREGVRTFVNLKSVIIGG